MEYSTSQKLEGEFAKTKEKLYAVIADNYQQAANQYVSQFIVIVKDLPFEERFQALSKLEKFILNFIEELGFNGQHAKAARQNAGLTQVAVAKMCGLYPQHISRWELGLDRPSTHTDCGKKYLAFLAKQGYDPCGLLNKKSEN